MTHVLDPKEGEIVCDPTCGSGGFLIKAFEYIREQIEDDVKNAKKKLHNKNADLIVLNSLRTAGAGFRTATNQVTIFARDGREFASELKSKREIAEEILQTAKIYIQ